MAALSHPRRFGMIWDCDRFELRTLEPLLRLQRRAINRATKTVSQDIEFKIKILLQKCESSSGTIFPSHGAPEPSTNGRNLPFRPKVSDQISVDPAQMRAMTWASGGPFQTMIM